MNNSYLKIRSLHFDRRSFRHISYCYVVSGDIFLFRQFIEIFHPHSQIPQTTFALDMIHLIPVSRSCISQSWLAWVASQRSIKRLSRFVMAFNPPSKLFLFKTSIRYLEYDTHGKWWKAAFRCASLTPVRSQDVHVHKLFKPLASLQAPKLWVLKISVQLHNKSIVPLVSICQPPVEVFVLIVFFRQIAYGN